MTATLWVMQRSERREHGRGAQREQICYWLYARVNPAGPPVYYIRCSMQERRHGRQRSMKSAGIPDLSAATLLFDLLTAEPERVHSLLDKVPPLRSRRYE